MKPHSNQIHVSNDLPAALPAEPHQTPVSNSHFLHAGQVFVSGEPTTISLILGSCVGIGIWDAPNAIGGATHYMLPNWDGKGVPSARYGSVAISILLQKLLDAGANRNNLRAKNIHTLASIADVSENDMARVSAVKVMEQIADVADEKRAHPGAQQTPGLQIIIVQHAPPEPPRGPVEIIPVRRESLPYWVLGGPVHELNLVWYRN